MRVMLDTNILISAFVFKSGIMNKLIELLSKKHTILISIYTVEELREVTKIKFKVREQDINKFFKKFPFEIIYSPKDIKENEFYIRDKEDYIIFYTAIVGNTDIFITGDKDFEDVKIFKPKIMNAKKFIEKYSE